MITVIVFSFLFLVTSAQNFYVTTNLYSDASCSNLVRSSSTKLPTNLCQSISCQPTEFGVWQAVSCTDAAPSPPPTLPIGYKVYEGSGCSLGGTSIVTQTFSLRDDCRVNEEFTCGNQNATLLRKTPNSLNITCDLVRDHIQSIEQDCIDSSFSQEIVGCGTAPAEFSVQVVRMYEGSTCAGIPILISAEAVVGCTPAPMCQADGGFSGTVACESQFPQVNPADYPMRTSNYNDLSQCEGAPNAVLYAQTNQCIGLAASGFGDAKSARFSCQGNGGAILQKFSGSGCTGQASTAVENPGCNIPAGNQFVQCDGSSLLRAGPLAFLGSFLLFIFL